MMKDQRYIYS